MGIFRGLAFHGLLQVGDCIEQRSGIEQLHTRKRRTWNRQASQPDFRIGQGAKAEFRTCAQIIHGFAHQFKFALQRCAILARLKLIDGTATGRACCGATQDCAQLAEFEEFLGAAAHVPNMGEGGCGVKSACNSLMGQYLIGALDQCLARAWAEAILIKRLLNIYGWTTWPHL